MKLQLDTSDNTDLKDVLGEMANILKAPNAFLNSLRELRHQFGWYQKACEWLKSITDSTPSGRITQIHCASRSNLLKFECEHETYFLKSPLIGCNEGKKTKAVFKISLATVPRVVAVNETLNSFVTKGFNYIDVSNSDAPRVAMEMVAMQVLSNRYVDELRHAGFDLRGPLELHNKIEEWERSNHVEKALAGRFKGLLSLSPKVKQMTLGLLEFNIPLTVVHGDLMPHNAASIEGEEGRNILYDWEFSYIGHPFCEMHELNDVIDEPALCQCLGLWLEWESMKRLEMAYHITRKLGWLLKMWHYLECMREADEERNSRLAWCADECFEDSLRCVNQ